MVGRRSTPGALVRTLAVGLDLGSPVLEVARRGFHSTFSNQMRHLGGWFAGPVLHVAHDVVGEIARREGAVDDVVVGVAAPGWLGWGDRHHVATAVDPDGRDRLVWMSTAVAAVAAMPATVATRSEVVIAVDLDLGISAALVAVDPTAVRELAAAAVPPRLGLDGMRPADIAAVLDELAVSAHRMGVGAVHRLVLVSSRDDGRALDELGAAPRLDRCRTARSGHPVGRSRMGRVSRRHGAHAIRDRPSSGSHRRHTRRRARERGAPLAGGAARRCRDRPVERARGAAARHGHARDLDRIVRRRARRRGNGAPRPLRGAVARRDRSCDRPARSPLGVDGAARCATARCRARRGELRRGGRRPAARRTRRQRCARDVDRRLGAEPNRGDGGAATACEQHQQLRFGGRGSVAAPARDRSRRVRRRRRDAGRSSAFARRATRPGRCPRSCRASRVTGGGSRRGDPLGAGARRMCRCRRCRDRGRTGRAASAGARPAARRRSDRCAAACARRRPASARRAARSGLRGRDGARCGRTNSAGWSSTSRS